jgi:Domain of unknown function (DUF4326)
VSEREHESIPERTRDECGAPKSAAPERIRLSRAKGWRMPPNTVKADRTTKLGNPFVVGIEGSAEECVKLHRYIMSGYIVLSCKATMEAQREHVAYVRANRRKFKGVNLACWCRAGQPCHVDTLLMVFNPAPAAAPEEASPRQVVQPIREDQP